MPRTKKATAASHPVSTVSPPSAWPTHRVSRLRHAEFGRRRTLAAGGPYPSLLDPGRVLTLGCRLRVRLADSLCSGFAHVTIRVLAPQRSSPEHPGHGFERNGGATGRPTEATPVVRKERGRSLGETSKVSNLPSSTSGPRPSPVSSSPEREQPDSSSSARRYSFIIAPLAASPPPIRERVYARPPPA